PKLERIAGAFHRPLQNPFKSEQFLCPKTNPTRPSARERLSPASLCGLKRVCWVSLIPLHIARRAIDGGDVLAGQAEPRLHLSTMTPSVHHATPENPDPLPLESAKELSLLQPPRSRPGGKLRQPLRDKPHVLVNVSLHARPLADRQELIDRRLVRPDELRKEPSLGQ